MSNYNDFLELHVLYHHGIKGQKWGIRRYQNEDGTLTEAGKRLRAKYRKEDGTLTKKGSREMDTDYYYGQKTRAIDHVSAYNFLMKNRLLKVSKKIKNGTFSEKDREKTEKLQNRGRLILDEMHVKGLDVYNVKTKHQGTLSKVFMMDEDGLIKGFELSYDDKK